MIKENLSVELAFKPRESSNAKHQEKSVFG
jgi:hypothetical protein